MAAVPSRGRAFRVERPAAPVADATRDLYERFHSQIFGYCLHQLGSREEAEDAVQTTFMNAFRGLERGIVPEIEQAWLFKIAHNVCLSRRRSSWRRGRVEAPNNMEVLQEVVPAREKVGDELIRLQDVLEQMPESQRRAILLREWQGLSYREIAAELDVSQAAVETLIFRARRALAQGLEETPDGAGRSWRKRARRGADVGGLLAGMKALLGGGGAVAVKIAATLAVGTIAAVGASVSSPIPTGHAAGPARTVARTAPATPATSEALRRAAPAAVAGRETSGVTRARPTVLRPATAARPRPVPPSPDPDPELPPAASRPAAPEAPASAQSTAPATAPAPLTAPGNAGSHAPAKDKPRRGGAAEPTRAPAAERSGHGRGHGKGNDKQSVTQDPAAASQPPLPVADEPVEVPAEAGQPEKQDEHGADKAEKDHGGVHGNGNGKGK